MALQEELRDTYESWAREYYLQNEKTQVDQHVDHFSRLQDIRKYQINKRLLDVGCSTGGFLRASKNDGWETFGVDLSKTVAKHCRDNGINVFGGTLHEAKFPDNYFDVITWWGVIEHVPNPYQCIEESYRILRKGGLLIFSVPSVDSFPFRILGSRYRYIAPEHLYYFSRNSIEALINRTSFSILKTYTDGFDPFSFWEDLIGNKSESNAHTHNREIKFVEKAKQAWWCYPVKKGYRCFLSLLYGAAMGEGWITYLEKK